MRSDGLRREVVDSNENWWTLMRSGGLQREVVDSDEKWWTQMKSGELRREVLIFVAGFVGVVG